MTLAELFAAQIVGAACFFDIKDWYITRVRKPWFSPPILAFPLIWTCLYVLDHKTCVRRRRTAATDGREACRAT